VAVQGAVRGDTPSGEYSKELQSATEALAHDMGKVIAKIFKEHIVANDHKWNVLYKEGWKIDSFIDLGQKANTGLVMATFSVHVRNIEANLA
jgi:hypothetical protein